MDYPKGSIYIELYKKYLGRSSMELLKKANFQKGQTAIDLCCGTGRLTQALLNSGAKHVLMVDQAPQMVDPQLKNDKRTQFTEIPVEVMVKSLANDTRYKGEGFDAIFCQQGVNYWLNKRTAAYLPSLLKPNGVFVFNTFKYKPSAVPQTKTYTIDNKTYVEVFYSVGNIVHHTQACEGLPIHTTQFKYFSEEDLRFILNDFSYYEVDDQDKTLIYTCYK